MAKNDNLQDFLTDVADAIRAKKGTTDKINPQDFSREIASIQSGVEPKEMKDVNFYDYDGTILYSYTWDEALQLTEMPPLPSHDGLICQGWNWTLEEMQANEGMCDVGAMYITDDGRTRLYIDVEDEDSKSVQIVFAGGESEAIGIIHWGDGSVYNVSINNGIYDTASHIYKTNGKYVIEYEPLSGRVQFGKDSSNSIMGWRIGSQKALYKIECGSNIMLNQYSFYNLYYLESITFTREIYFNRNANLFTNTQVKHLSLPRCNFFPIIGDSSIYTVAINGNITDARGSFGRLTQVKRLIFPKGCISKNGSQTFHSCYHLSKIHNIEMYQLLPYTFYSNTCMQHTPTLNDSITLIGQSCFSSCKSLKEIIVPASVTSIAKQAFNNCTSLTYIDFTKLSAVPTLDNADAFTGIPANCEIRVPMALVDEWKAATNWSTYADYIVGY